MEDGIIVMGSGVRSWRSARRTYATKSLRRTLGYASRGGHETNQDVIELGIIYEITQTA